MHIVHIYKLHPQTHFSVIQGGLRNPLVSVTYYYKTTSKIEIT